MVDEQIFVLPWMFCADLEFLCYPGFSPGRPLGSVSDIGFATRMSDSHEL